VDKVGSARASLKVNSRIKVEVAKPYSFEQLFFRLPPELRDQVIEFLDFREAMNLRQVSQQFRAAVSVNGSAISKRFLFSNPLPPLALALYPHPSPDLIHLHKVGHRHAVAWRLADHIVRWLRQDMFLYGSRFQKQQFQPKKIRMKQRLLPALLVLGKFFERCHEFLESHGSPDGDRRPSLQKSAPLAGGTEKLLDDTVAFPFKKEIMAHCGNELLMQTHDVALILSTFLQRTMRPSTKYGSVERTHRYGPVKPPDEKEVAAVLYHGGLPIIVEILDLEDLDKKAAAVQTYCYASSQQAPGPPAYRGVTEKGRLCHLQTLLPRLPSLDDAWQTSAEAALIERRVIRGRLDLNSYTVALRQLFLDSETPADALYRNGHDLWHALSDGENRHRLRRAADSCGRRIRG